MFLLKTITLVMPCYNEEKGIERILEKAPDFIDEIIVVDNGSDDKSAEIAKKHGVKVIREEIRGYGAALRKGIANASGNIVAIIDADGSYPIEKIEDILLFMERGHFDFISGCRFPLVDPSAMPWMNLIANYFVSFLSKVLCGAAIRDLQSGMMVFRKEVFLKTDVRSDGMAFSQEFKIKAWRSNFRCSEMHIPYYKRIGKVKFRKFNDSVSNLLHLIKLIHSK